jgi:hypothetical protein
MSLTDVTSAAPRSLWQQDGTHRPSNDEGRHS